MDVRRSSRTKVVKKFTQESDSEDEVVVKKFRSSVGIKKQVKYREKLDQSNIVEGKRERKKNNQYAGLYKMNDSDSDYDAGYYSNKRSRKNKGVRGPPRAKAMDLHRVEFLLDWKRKITTDIAEDNDKSSKTVTVKDMIDTDLSKYGNNLQALFVNIPWQTQRCPTGVSMKEFKKIDFNMKLMKNGIVFIWSEKEILGDLVHTMEEKGFFYIENFIVALLDSSKANPENKEKEEKKKETKKGNKNKKSNKAEEEEDEEDGGSYNEEFLKDMSHRPELEADQLFYEGNSVYLKASKKVLMMFRRSDNTKNNLELRHQRTADVIFDLSNTIGDLKGTIDQKGKEYVYRMIETLLPKALYDPEEKHIKMMELWADPEAPRPGWVGVCCKK